MTFMQFIIKVLYYLKLWKELDIIPSALSFLTAVQNSVCQAAQTTWMKTGCPSDLISLAQGHSKNPVVM